MAVNIGPKIGIDGEAQYRKELNNIIQQAKTLASEMKAVTSAFDKNDKSQESLTAQAKVLNQQIQVQQQRVAKLQEGLAAAAKQFGEADTRTQKWQQAVNEATADLNRMKSQLSSLENNVDDVGDALEGASREAASFGDVLSANIIVEGAKAIASAVSDVVESTKEYRTILASLEISSEKAGYSAEETAQTYRQLFGVLGDDQTAATATANLQALSLSQEQLTQLTNGAIGAWATYGDSIPIDSLSEAINETIRTSTVTGTFADVLNWAGQSEDEFNAKLAAASTESERANLVLQAMADQGLTKAGEAWQQNNQDIVAANEAQADLNDAMAELGEVIVPAVTAATQVIAEIAQAAADAAKAIVEVVKEGNPLISVLTGAATAAGSLALALNFSAITETVTASLTALKTAVLGVNAAIAANPIGLAISVIAGLVAAITTLWLTNEDFRDAVINIGKEIVDFVSGIVSTIGDFFTKTIPDALNTVVDFTRNNWQGILQFLVNPFAGAFTLLYDNCEGFRQTVDTLVQNIKNAFSNMADGIKNTVGRIKDSIVNGIGAAVDWIKALPGQALSWGADMITGFANGIMSAMSGLLDRVRNVADTIRSYLHFSRPDVGPLRDYESWMPDMMMGMAEGIRANAWRLEDALNAATSYMGSSIAAPTVNGVAAGSTSNISITINAPAGMDVNALADAVAYRLQTLTQQKEAVW